MLTLESLLKEASALTAAERRRLADTLLAQLRAEAEADAEATGRLGLEALTASTRIEDWSPFYPTDLRQSRG